MTLMSTHKMGMRIKQDTQVKGLVGAKWSMNVSCYCKRNYYCFTGVIITITITIEKSHLISLSLDFSWKSKLKAESDSLPPRSTRIRKKTTE